jgi:hypothetical protein
MKFQEGDKAYKPKGYKFPCTIVSIFKTSDGQTRLVGEMDEYGLLHIFNEGQLELVESNQYREKLTAEWLAKTFEEITDDIMNGETLYDVLYSKNSNGGYIITFSIDLGRRGKDEDNSIRIYFNSQNELVVSVRLCEQLEGGGIEEEFEEKIKNYITEE